MSEKGCLFSSKFNTISSNKIETKNLFTEGHIVRDETIHQDENGDINEKSRNIYGEVNITFTETSFFPVNNDETNITDIRAGGRLEVESRNIIPIEIPKKSIIKSLQLVICNNNFDISSMERGGGASGQVDNNGLIFRIVESPYLPSYPAKTIFEDSGTDQCQLFSGEDSTGTANSNQLGSFLSINTIIPIISDYQFNTYKDRHMCASNGGYARYGDNDTRTIQMGNNSGKYTLYNDTDEPRQVYIQLCGKEEKRTGENVPINDSALRGFFPFGQDSGDGTTIVRLDQRDQQGPTRPPSVNSVYDKIIRSSDQRTTNQVGQSSVRDLDIGGKIKVLISCTRLSGDD